mmetsp:Transcript_53225/g.123915  ORF Transcript_53225/g.123915 Transcript_53225/m.123915 type:complete len:267 (+) Transcript_53225:374-1174(+)
MALSCVYEASRVICQRINGKFQATKRHHPLADGGILLDHHPQTVKSQCLHLRVDLVLAQRCQQLFQKAGSHQRITVVGSATHAFGGLQHLLPDPVAPAVVPHHCNDGLNTTKALELRIALGIVVGREPTPDGELRLGAPIVRAIDATSIKEQLDATGLAHANTILLSKVVETAEGATQNKALLVREAPHGRRHQLDCAPTTCIKGVCLVEQAQTACGGQTAVLYSHIIRKSPHGTQGEVDRTQLSQWLFGARVVEPEECDVSARSG